MYMSAYMRVSFDQVEVALHIYLNSPFPTPFNDSYSVYNCLLCKNPENEPTLVT